jgi:hypothetical protein
MLIINAPSFFSFAWKIIKKFVDPRTAARIQLFSSSNEKASQQALEKLICKQTQLPIDYGGGNISLEDSFLEQVQQSDPLIIKQNIDLLHTRKGKKSTSTVQILKPWPIQENETIDITIYTRSVSEATITILLNGIPIKTIQAQCLLVNNDDGDDNNNNNDVGDDNDNNNQKTPYPNRIVVSDYDASSSLSSEEQQILVLGPGEVTVTATDLDSPIAKEKQYNHLSRGYFLIVGDVKKVVVYTKNLHQQQVNNNNNIDSEKHVSFTDSTKNIAQQQQVSVTMAGLSAPPKSSKKIKKNNNATTSSKNTSKKMKKKIKK